MVGSGRTPNAVGEKRLQIRRGIISLIGFVYAGAIATALQVLVQASPGPSEKWLALCVAAYLTILLGVDWSSSYTVWMSWEDYTEPLEEILLL